MAQRRRTSGKDTQTALQNRLAQMKGQEEALRRMVETSTDYKKMLTLLFCLKLLPLPTPPLLRKGWNSIGRFSPIM